MAISSSTSTGSGFNFDGVVSGLHTGDIISKLMQLEQAPLFQLQKQQAKIQLRDKAYQDVASKATSLQSAISTLLLQSALTGKTATSSSPSIASATAGASTANGTFGLNVISLATATSATSSGALGSAANLAPTTTLFSAGMAIAPSSGTFTINGQTITVDASATGDTWSSLQSKISTATGGAVTLNLGTNGVSLTSNSPMQIGASTDTSNFLSAAHLAGAAQTGSGPYTIASNQLLGEAIVSNPLSSAGLNVPGGIAASGTFSINGVAINWTNGDSINSVLNRINASSAGVTASYDPTKDKITLTNTGTGTQSISLSDTSGNFLQAMHVVGATQTYGAPASYTITQNGVTGPTQYSNTNTVTSALPGVNLTLTAVGSTSVTVAQDTQTATNNINNFVAAFNSLVDVIDADTKVDPTGATAGVLSGDSSIQGIADQLRSMTAAAAIVPAGAAYTTLADIGISTGAFGAQVGSTNHLKVDTAKLTTALQTNPQAAFQVLSGLTGTVSVSNDPTNPWLASASGLPSGQVYSGSYAIRYSPAGNTLTSTFTPTNGVPQNPTLGVITPGGTNSTLIIGTTLTAQGTLPASAGIDTVTYNVTSRGVLQSLNDYLSKSLGAGGLFQTEQSNAQSETSNLTSQIANQNDLLAQRQQTLQAQFTAMETALAQLNSQSASFLSQMGVSSSSASH